MASSTCSSPSFECSICLLVPDVENDIIVQCHNGHFFCGRCVLRYKHTTKKSTCPVCRDEMGNKAIRCLALEHVLQKKSFNCRNEGCDFKGKKVSN